MRDKMRAVWFQFNSWWKTAADLLWLDGFEHIEQTNRKWEHFERSECFVIMLTKLYWNKWYILKTTFSTLKLTHEWYSKHVRPELSSIVAWKQDSFVISLTDEGLPSSPSCSQNTPRWQVSFFIYIFWELYKFPALHRQTNLHTCQSKWKMSSQIHLVSRLIHSFN